MAHDEVSSDGERNEGGHIRVEVAYAQAPREVDLVSVTLEAGADLQAALVASGLLQRHGLRLGPELRCGVWAKLRPLDHPLREGDRVEIYRELKVDPKEARRQRYRRQAPKTGRGATRGSG